MTKAPEDDNLLKTRKKTSMHIKGVLKQRKKKKKRKA